MQKLLFVLKFLIVSSGGTLVLIGIKRISWDSIANHKGLCEKSIVEAHVQTSTALQITSLYYGASHVFGNGSFHRRCPSV